jgi:V/A-type H+-transporting ATPase subunit I
MIAKMLKVYCVCRNSDRQRLLDALADLGVLHITPVDPGRAVAAEQTVTALDRLARARQVLADLEPTGQRPSVDAVTAAEETLEIERQRGELRNRLVTLARQVDHLAIWGDMRTDQLAQLRQAGIEPRFYAVPADQLDQVRAEVVQQIASDIGGDRVAVAIIDRDDNAALPDGAQELEPPAVDRPTLRAEAADIDTQLTDLDNRQRELAHLVGDMQRRHAELSRQAAFTVAEGSGFDQGELYAIQGWAPQDRTTDLPAGLEKAGLDVAVQAIEPAEDELPPTLVRYPKWVKPIKALFKILNTTPGYREFDLAPFFMLAMPIFTAMLVGDAGYGLLFVLAGALGYRKLAKLGGPSAPQLIIVFGVATVLWGAMTGNYFGVSPHNMMQADGPWPILGQALGQVDFLWRADDAVSRLLVIKISFVLAVLHLVTSHLRQVIGFFPDPRFIAEIGWCAFLIGMFGVVWIMFDPDAPVIPVNAILALMGGGAAMIVLFGFPRRNPLARVGLGLIGSIMPMINAFGDTISYIRLMAVGLASYYIAVAFNGLAMDVAGGHKALWIAAAVILVLAHAMNIVLCLIAIFAHGVRLNMLEFSSNAGVQWTGYAYEPFALAATDEGA